MQPLLINGLFGGGVEIGPNKFAIGITLFGASLYLDIGALIRGEISLADIGMTLLRWYRLHGGF